MFLGLSTLTSETFLRLWSYIDLCVLLSSVDAVGFYRSELTYCVLKLVGFGIGKYFITLKAAGETVQTSQIFFFVPSLINSEFRFTLIFYAASKRVLYRILPLTIT